MTAVFELRVGISVSGTDRFAAHRVEAYGDNAGWRTGAEVLISDGLIAELGATPLSRSGQEQP